MFLSVTSREFGHHGTYLVLDFIFESVFLLSSLMKKKKKKKDHRDFKLDAFFSVTNIRLKSFASAAMFNYNF